MIPIPSTEPRPTMPDPKIIVRSYFENPVSASHSSGHV
jgi:hypothetical protein